MATRHSSRLVTGQEALIAINAGYSSSLNSTIHGDMSLKAYQEWLNNNNLPALTLADEVAQCWLGMFEEHAEEVAKETGIDESELMGPMQLYEDDIS